MASRRRLDVELLRRGLVSSREQAQQAIAEGRVLVDGAPASKAARQVAPAQAVVVQAPDDPWASRGAGKLVAALANFAVDPRGKRCLDAGASTGGFTDVLLQRGAAHVTAVDVGYGQLVDRLRSDARVHVLERTNIRHLEPTELPGGAVAIVVADLSFISLRTVLPAITGLALPMADAILLVKPQFEVGKTHVGRGGVVREPGLWTTAITGVVDRARELGWQLRGVIASPVRGPAGNVEFPAWFQRPSTAQDGDAEQVIAAAVADGAQVRDA
ncbi:MAG: TlyA family RNA methyltransferase [Nitriliruptorales bacterium]|nr:TlyA family RNA methyltransferase [Nitriliruptorales bacterium]